MECKLLRGQLHIVWYITFVNWNKPKGAHRDWTESLTWFKIFRDHYTAKFASGDSYSELPSRYKPLLCPCLRLRVQGWSARSSAWRLKGHCIWFMLKKSFKICPACTHLTRISWQRDCARGYYAIINRYLRRLQPWALCEPAANLKQTTPSAKYQVASPPLC